ncbi:MAG: glycosyltransferase family 2 protein [Pseudomonadota bacterium]
MPPVGSRRILFSAQRNEGPFLLEWIAYHRVIGFTDIILYSNDCTDGSDHLLDRLAEAGVLEHHRHAPDPDRSAQRQAAEAAAKAGLFHDGDWVMWLDSDEFLYVQPGAHDLDSLFAALPSFDVLAVAWRFFGDSGHATWPGRHIDPAFSRAEKRNRTKRAQIKSLFRWTDRVETPDIHRPIYRRGTGPEDIRAFHSGGHPMPDAFFDRDRTNPWSRITDGSRYYRFAMVAHFSVRTPDMYAAKATRGDGVYPGAAAPVVRDDRFYRRKNFNDVEEKALHSLAPATTSEIGRLMQLPGVKNAAKAIAGFRPESQLSTRA